MTLKTRRLLYISFILAFLIITSSLILYATGYRIKLTWPIDFNQTFQKTGMFIFDTEPHGAKIYLNKKPQELFFKKIFTREESFIKTPTKIKNLLPGEYDITLELEGYWPWRKN